MPCGLQSLVALRPNNSFKPNPLRGFSPKPESLGRVGLIQVLGALSMDRGERRRRTRAERVAARTRDALAKKEGMARRKAELRQAFRDRHKLGLSFREKVSLVFGLFFAATGGPLYPWLPDELRYQPYRRANKKHRDRA